MILQDMIKETFDLSQYFKNRHLTKKISTVCDSF